MADEDEVIDGSEPEPWFLAWTKELALGDDSELASERWDAVTTTADNLLKADIEPLVRVAVGSRQGPAAEWLQRYEGLLKEHYPDFSARGNPRELKLLAATSLVRIFVGEDNSDNVLAALACTTASMGGVRKFDLPVDLNAEAAAALRDLSLGAERRPKISVPALVNHKPLFGPAVEKFKGNPQPQFMVQALSEAGVAVTDAVNNAQQVNIKLFRSVVRRLRQQDEELQMLWWLIGNRSDDLNCAFAELDSNARPLVLAKELADHTTAPPGPASVRALLSRAELGAAASVKVVDAVAAAPLDWLQAHCSLTSASPVTQPLHFAIARQLETGPGKTWVPGFAAAANVPEDLALPTLTLAEQFYRERLLIQLMH